MDVNEHDELPNITLGNKLQNPIRGYVKVNIRI